MENQTIINLFNKLLSLARLLLTKIEQSCEIDKTKANQIVDYFEMFDLAPKHIKDSYKEIGVYKSIVTEFISRKTDKYVIFKNTLIKTISLLKKNENNIDWFYTNEYLLTTNTIFYIAFFITLDENVETEDIVNLCTIIKQTEANLQISNN